ncbi:uncharacterized protein [Elaeis guineensis]|uniref:uncharacterized protein isoform X2 n=1 Tax=Elaeis guineensis var. tenera TaxID=51953 RepID=UPI003C6CEDB2
MEKLLFDSKLGVVFLGTTCSKPPIGQRSGRRFSRQVCSCREIGFRMKVSYSISRSSSEDIDSTARGKFLKSDSSIINGSEVAACLWPPARGNYILDAYEDEYGGIIIKSESLPWNANDFASSLRASLSQWKVEGKKGVWLKLPLDHSEFVPIAVKEGFKYHHAEPKHVMLTYWIPEGPCLLPANASHQVGVGGFVMNDKNEVLVVQEKYCASTFAGLWKLPTGFILESEEIFSGAVREVKEETGIDTEFVEVIAFRHAHHVAFGKSDLFFICMLRPLSSQIKIDELEVQAAKQPSIQDDNMFKKIIDICIARLVHGMEYGFGAHEYPTSGVFEVEPRCCPGFVFRRSVWLGTTDMSYSEFRMFIENLAGKYHGDTYHLIVKNCNHFTDDVCMHLTGKPIPGWVNRLAKFVSGSFCNCLLPENIQVTAVGNLPAQPTLSEDESVPITSSAEESDEDDPDHQLLLTSNNDPAHSRAIESC